MNGNRFRSSTPLSAQTIRRPVDERAERPAPRAFLLEVRTEWTCRARCSSPPEHRARSPHEQPGHDWNARPPGREGDSLRASSCSSNGFGANTRPTQTMDGYDGCAGSALSAAQHPGPGTPAGTAAPAPRPARRRSPIDGSCAAADPRAGQSGYDPGGAPRSPAAVVTSQRR